MRTILLSLACCLAAATCGLADGGSTEKIATLIDAQTLVVVRIDVNATDPQTLAKLADTIVLPALPKDVADGYDAGRKMATEAAGAWRKAFLEAGGKELWFVVSLAYHIYEPFVVVVPLDTDADEKALAKLLTAPDPKSRTDGPPPMSLPLAASRMMRGMLIAGREASLGMLAELEPVEQTSLGEALAAAKGAPIQLAYVPSADTLRVLRETLPNLPPELGGGSISSLANVRWAGLGVWLTPKLRIAGRIECGGERRAGGFLALLDRTLSAAAAHKDIRRVLPDLRETIAPLLPTVQGTGLTVEISQEQLAAAIRKVATPALLAARREARRAVSAANVRGIALAVACYDQDHKDALPTLEALLAGKYVTAAVLRNPRIPDKETGYVLRRPAESLGKIEKPGETVLIYEAFDAWPAGGIVVGYADGHCETLGDQALFEMLTGVKLPVEGEADGKPKASE